MQQKSFEMWSLFRKWKLVLIIETKFIHIHVCMCYTQFQRSKNELPLMSA